jgi:hypothetical protein
VRREDVDNDLSALVFEFFFRFSRFESALKERGYRQWNKPGDRAIPSWRKFAADHRDSYEATPAALALIKAKPNIQIITDNCELGFVDEVIPDNVAILDRVIAHANTVRNNLFHGGKHGGGGWDNPDRIRLLLTNTIGVLDDLADRGSFGRDYSGDY